MTCHRGRGLAAIDLLRAELTDAERCAARGCDGCRKDAIIARVVLRQLETIARTWREWAEPHGLRSLRR